MSISDSVVRAATVLAAGVCALVGSRSGDEGGDDAGGGFFAAGFFFFLPLGVGVGDGSSSARAVRFLGRPKRDVLGSASS